MCQRRDEDTQTQTQRQEMRKVHEEKLIDRAVVGDGLWRSVKGMKEDGMYGYVCLCVYEGGGEEMISSLLCVDYCSKT